MTYKSSSKKFSIKDKDKNIKLKDRSKFVIKKSYYRH